VLLTTPVPNHRGTLKCSLHSIPNFGTARVHSRAQSPHLPFPLLHPLRSQLWSRLIRTPSPLPRAELPLPIPLRRSSSGSTALDFTLREEPALAPIEPLQQGIIMATEVRANGDATAPATSKTEWYAGATRFELELEVRYELYANAPPRCQPPTATKLTPPSSSNPSQTLTTCITYACKSTSRTTLSSNGASTSNTSPSPSTSPFSRTFPNHVWPCGVIPSLFRSRRSLKAPRHTKTRC
jgi:hypothetical protein